MRIVGVTNVTRGRSLGLRVGVADRWWARLRGLLDRPPLDEGEGLLLAPCRAIHTFGMSYALDVAFLSKQGAVVALYHRLAPGRRSRWHRRATMALELPPGTLAATGTQEGDALQWQPVAELQAEHTT